MIDRSWARITAILLFQAGLFGQGPISEAGLWQFYPSRLAAHSDEEFQAGGREPYRTLVFVEADLNKTGSKDYVVVVFSNGFLGAVSVLRKSPLGLAQVAAPVYPMMQGGAPLIDTIDLDHDGKPELVVSFLAGHSNKVNWVFKWDGRDLQFMGPSEQQPDGSLDTMLCNVSFADFDGDGLLDAHNPWPDLGLGALADWDREEHPHQIYRQAAGRFLNTPIEAAYGKLFGRPPGSSPDETDSFVVESPIAGYHLVVLNGGLNGTRVSSGSIALNGSVVVQPNQFGQSVSSIRVPVTVGPRNSIAVKLNGNPNGSVLIYVLKP